MKRIGLFGGSFDPVHNGHVLRARAALEELSPDRLFIVPATRSPFQPEQQPAPPAARLLLRHVAFAICKDCQIDPQAFARGRMSHSFDTIHA